MTHVVKNTVRMSSSKVHFRGSIKKSKGEKEDGFETNLPPALR